MLSFASTRTLAIGEAMIEMSEAGDGTYRRSFAGDTFNTAWHMSQIPDTSLPVGFVTKVGTDPMSQQFVADMDLDGLDTSFVGRVPDRTMGLYVIELDGVERSFHYWREASAARLLAEDQEWLARALAGAGLIHVSGITLGILSPKGRDRLFSALASARRDGARVSFDPNLRPKLWSSPEETRAAVTAMSNVADIVLPSFDDEQALWGDTSPHQTVDRFCSSSATEVVVKNGNAPVICWAGGERTEHACAPVTGIQDTSGAGDAFNAGYLAARLAGFAPTQSIASGQAMSAEVLQHFGARIPLGHVPALVTPTRQAKKRT